MLLIKIAFKIKIIDFNSLMIINKQRIKKKKKKKKKIKKKKKRKKKKQMKKKQKKKKNKTKNKKKLILNNLKSHNKNWEKKRQLRYIQQQK